MSKTSVVPKKRRGPAPTGKGTQIGMRWQGPELTMIDDWVAAQSKPYTRSEAIRRLVELGLKATTPAKLVSKASNKTRAAELAAKVVDKIIDPLAPADERDRRRRALTKGPREFREGRVDLPKAKGK